MRVLFVNHDVSPYGAASSLSLMLRNNPFVEYDMIVPDHEKGKEDIIREKFNIQSGQLFFFRLITDRTCFVGGGSNDKSFFKDIRFRFHINKDYLKFIFLVLSGRYDVIYLNSIILYKYIVKNVKTVIHIREIYKHTGNPVVNYINKSAGVVFIDNATFLPFSNIIKTKYTIINNPFDMTALEGSRRVNVFEGVDISNKTIFSIIGQVVSSKGVLEVVRAFHEVENQDIILFIAGICSKKFLKEIIATCSNDERIVVLGHRSSVDELYNITDYLIRGERYQCIGRTIIEGLFAGCSVLVPGVEPYREFKGCLDRFVGKINYYPPGDFSSLRRMIARHAGRKMKERKYYSNVSEHVQQINVFLKDIVCTS